MPFGRWAEGWAIRFRRAAFSPPCRRLTSRPLHAARRTSCYFPLRTKGFACKIVAIRLLNPQLQETIDKCSTLLARLRPDRGSRVAIVSFLWAALAGESEIFSPQFVVSCGYTGNKRLLSRLNAIAFVMRRSLVRRIPPTTRGRRVLMRAAF
jgi:hypothetical protein